MTEPILKAIEYRIVTEAYVTGRCKEKAQYRHIYHNIHDTSPLSEWHELNTNDYLISTVGRTIESHYCMNRHKIVKEITIRPYTPISS